MTKESADELEKDGTELTEEKVRVMSDESLINLLETFTAVGVFSPNVCNKNKEILRNEILVRLKERKELLNKKEKGFKMRTKAEIFTRKRIMGPFSETKEEEDIWSHPGDFVKK